MSVCDDNWDYTIDLNGYENETFKSFQCRVGKLNEMLCKKLEDGFKVAKSIYDGSNVQYHEDDLREFVEKNKGIRNEIDIKIEALTQKQGHYESLKKDQQLLSQEIKERHEAFLMAKKYYKKLLKLYHTIESRKEDKQTIFIQFFTESKKDSENYSVRLLRNTTTRQYLLLETTPKLQNLKELQRKLEETNDVPGALCSIRQVFIAMKSNKKHL